MISPTSSALPSLGATGQATQVEMAVAKKSLDMAKMEGEAAVQMLDDAAQMMEQNQSVTTPLDLYA